MAPLRNLAKTRLLLIIISSLTLITLSVFSGNLIQYAYSDSNYGAAGDWGCTSNTDATVSNMNGKNPERVFGLGDYSYASTGTCWFNKIGPIDSITKIAIGNHEDDDGEGFSGYMSHFGLSQTYYAYTHDVTRVIVMDTDRNSFSSGSAQKNFVQSELQSASTNPNIKWIIVYLHKPLYTSPNTCGSSSCSNTGSTAASLRDNYHAMFDQYGVDLVLQGHVHNYQRTFTLKYDGTSTPTITSNNANTYTEGNGEVFAIVGTGGVNFHALSGKASFTSSQQDDYFGQLDVKTTDNGNKLEGKFYRNGNNAILDSFSITKAGNSPPVANPQTVTVNKDTAKQITLTATDPNNDPLTYSIVTQPSHGTLSPSTPGGPARTYTPQAGYVGPDSFTFKANDGTVDSNTATISITVQDTTSCTTNLPISGVTASGNDGNVPSNVLDNNLATRWSSNGIGQWIRADLGSTKNICSVDIAWYNGNARQYHFVIATSTDGTTFTNKFSGDSSGTTLNSEKYTIPSTDARYVRVTVNGNTANNWASITELDVFGSSGGTSDVDKFGIKKLYSTKSNGEEWYMDMNNPLGDSRFNPQNTITKNPDGSWKMKATQVRMGVYTSTGYDGDDIPTLDHGVIASKGYMLAPNDWRNFEMTQYVKVNTSPSDDNFSPNGRGGRHTGSGAPEGCEGSSMKGDVFFSGKVRFAKEQWHVSYVFTSLKTPTGSIEDKWIGIKFIVYNFVENNKVVVKTELWLDTNNNGNFVKVDENVDRGGWGTEGTECGGAPDQIISWGGPITTFRWDTATDVDFKNLSVREILSPQ